MKRKEQIAELDDDSTDIYHSNINERHSDRPDRSFMNGAFSQADSLCLHWQNCSLLLQRVL